MYLYPDHETICWRFGKTNATCLSYSSGIPTVPHGLAVSEGDPLKYGLMCFGLGDALV